MLSPAQSNQFKGSVAGACRAKDRHCQANLGHLPIGFYGGSDELVGDPAPAADSGQREVPGEEGFGPSGAEPSRDRTDATTQGVESSNRHAEHRSTQPLGDRPDRCSRGGLPTRPCVQSG
jgi:hypothetical protein